MNLRLAGRPCLVVGGGAVALGKVQGLLEAGADVTVVAPEVDERIAALGVRVERRPYRPGEAAGYRFVVSATGDPAVNQQVLDDGEAAGQAHDPDPQRRPPAGTVRGSCHLSGGQLAWLWRRLPGTVATTLVGAGPAWSGNVTLKEPIQVRSFKSDLYWAGGH